MLSGWINIDKPVGVTSNQVLGYLKRVLGNKPKIGHAGTLDPLASGVLPVALGEATKTIPYLMEARKTYEFTIKFGAETETDDAEGKITKTTDFIPDFKELEKILPYFTGKIKQTPPAYSAIKINGQRAYDLARKGEEFEIKERGVTIYNLKLKTLEILVCECSKGTYIRSLGRDIARALGSLGHITYLRRVSYGIFDERTSVAINHLCHSREGGNLAQPFFWIPTFAGMTQEDKEKQLQTSRDYLISRMQSTDAVLDDIPVLQVDFETVKRLRNGLEVSSEAPKGIYRIYFENKFQAIVESSGSSLKTQRVFNL